MEVIYVGVAAFCGAMATALLGWAEAQESFMARKFLGSVLRGVIAAVGVAAAFNYSEIVVPLSYLIAFLSGAGVDTGGKRLVATVRNMVA